MPQQTGLTQKQAQRLLEQNGPNELQGKKGENLAALFFSQFKDVMIPSVVSPSKMNVSFLGNPAEVVPFISYWALKGTTLALDCVADGVSVLAGVSEVVGVLEEQPATTNASASAERRFMFIVFSLSLMVRPSFVTKLTHWLHIDN